MRFAAVAAAATMAGVAIAHDEHYGGAAYDDHHKNETAPAYVTEVVTAFTTYCPEPTELVHAGETYTVTEATTLTITNCPGGCTITKPATYSEVSVCVDCATYAPVAEPTAPAEEPYETHEPYEPYEAPTEAHEPYEAPTEAYEPYEPYETPYESPAAPVAPYPSGNATAPIVAPAPTGTGAPTESVTGAVEFEGAASAVTATGAGLLAIFGLVAAL